MKAQDVALHEFLTGPKQFVVPIFQRTYDWGTHHCEQLWNDIVRVGSTGSQSGHFIGSVVCVTDAEANKPSIANWMVIDGQQRLTTLTLFLIAICRMLEEQPVGTFEFSHEEIDDYFLKNQFGKDDLRHRLRLTQRDRDTLVALLDKTELPKNPSQRLIENFEFFQEKLNSTNLAKAYAGFRKLMIVEVVLKQGHDDPQMIFESMNSTGLDLSQADLIRNFVLMGQPQAQQTRLYNDYWHPMEKDFGTQYRKEFDTFVRYFLAMRQRLPRPLKANKVYREFKEYCQKEREAGKPIADVLADMRQLSRYFVRYYFFQEQDDELRRAFQSLRTLTDGAASLVLRLYEFYTEKTLSRDDFVKIVHTLESYLFRRLVCDFPSNSLPRIFASLTNSIDPEAPLRSIEVLLHRFSKRRRFPTDQEFRNSLMTRDIYSMKLCKFLLDRLENDSKEKVETESLTVEHVMPQTQNLKQEWREVLGEGWKEDQATWLHRLGNLTLTGYNSKYSDRPFEYKKKTEGGFDDSPLRLNQFIKQQTTWNIPAIEERGKKLAEHALRVWKPLAVKDEVLREFKLSEAKKASKKHSVDDVEGLDGQRPLFDMLSHRIRNLGDGVTELFLPKNITYWTSDFFVQVLPRKQCLDLVLDLDFDEIDDPNGFCRDTSQQSHVKNCTVNGGIILQVNNEESIDKAMQFIAMAYDNASN